MKNANGLISTTSSNTAQSQSTGLKTYFKTHEGRYKLYYDKTYPSTLLHYAHGKTVSQVTLAHLKDKPVPSTPTGQSSTFSATSGVRSAAVRLWGGSNGGRSLSFVGGNGTSKNLGGNSRIGSIGASSSSNATSNSNFDGKGTYLIFNVGDAIFISDLNSQDKDPVKSIHFSNSNPMCHAFDQDSKDGHDLIIGLNTGDVYSVSLRQQLQDVGKKLVGAQHYNKDGSVNNRQHLIPCDVFCSYHCTCIAWVPGGDGAFVVGHADGNLYNRDGAGDSSFTVVKDQTQFSVSHARYSKSNPIARWHICQGSIDSISFSTDGTYIATVGRDVCFNSMDGKYILTGGEDDLVQVWSMEDRKVVAWGEGHNSWVSGVAFDSYWSSPNSNDNEETVRYRFGSVGQDTQLLLWDLEMDEIVVPLRRPSGGSPTYSAGSQSSQWDSVVPLGTLQPAPSMLDVLKISPLVTHRVHTEPLSGLIFTQESVLTACREGHIKIWIRPAAAESQSSNAETLLSTSLKEKPSILSKVGNSSHRQ
ncbi:putative catabolite repression protein creC [Glycine max]|nr:putative catabolite repression protein creC [Glycine max]